MPTMVFLLGAAACYARASAGFYNKLLNNRVFGPILFGVAVAVTGFLLKIKTRAIGIGNRD